MNRNQVIKSLKKSIETVQEEKDHYEKLGNRDMVQYLKGMITGFELALDRIGPTEGEWT